MTIELFRSDPDRYLAFRDALSNPIVQEAIAVLATASPVNTNIKNGITDVEAHITLGTERGYALYARKFREMGEAWPLKRGRAEESYGVKKE